MLIHFVQCTFIPVKTPCHYSLSKTDVSSARTMGSLFEAIIYAFTALFYSNFISISRSGRYLTHLFRHLLITQQHVYG